MILAARRQSCTYMNWNSDLQTLGEPLLQQLEPEERTWLEERLASVLESTSGRELFLAYSLIGRKLQGGEVTFPASSEGATAYLAEHKIRQGELARIYLLASALEAKPELFTDKVSKLIEMADTGELIVFLRYLPVLPGSEAFLAVAVEALRTNISDVFDAIALNNPYPATHFNEQQWNQMYLKAAFMQRDLLQIIGVDRRANADLARIISDYAHERWAASRDIDPLFWRPVGRFLKGQLLEDMRRLLEQGDPAEQMAGYLCCRVSESEQAAALISVHPLSESYRQNPFEWKDIKSNS